MAEEGEEVPRPVWEGAFDEEGRPHGKGILTYPAPPAVEDEEEKPGDKYEGEMVNGSRDGQGKYVWSDGSYYDGTYTQNQKHGRGVQTFPDKGRYEGPFENDRFNGEGEYFYPSGDYYMGQFKDGLKHGQGMYNSKDGHCQFVGTWQDGSFVEGRWVFHDGSVYEGKFTNSQPQGEGKYIFARSGLSQDGAYSKTGSWDAAVTKIVF